MAGVTRWAPRLLHERVDELPDDQLLGVLERSAAVSNQAGRRRTVRLPLAVVGDDGAAFAALEEFGLRYDSSLMGYDPSLPDRRSGRGARALEPRRCRFLPLRRRVHVAAGQPSSCEWSPGVGNRGVRESQQPRDDHRPSMDVRPAGPLDLSRHASVGTAPTRAIWWTIRLQWRHTTCACRIPGRSRCFGPERSETSAW